jgi:hypothetical protein
MLSSNGLTPGYQHWDHTPSPLLALNGNVSRGEMPNEMESRSSGAAEPEFTMSSVRQLVKHRLTVAKQGCDRELRFIVSDITAFVEENLHLSSSNNAIESDIEQEEVLQDVRVPIGASPRLTYSDLDDDLEPLDREVALHSQGKLCLSIACMSC